MKFNLAEYRKGLVAFAGFLGVVVDQGLLPNAIKPWGAAVLTGLTAAGVVYVPNAKPAVPPGA